MRSLIFILDDDGAGAAAADRGSLGPGLGAGPTLAWLGPPAEAA